MLALGQPCLGAGSRHGGINYLYVICHRHDLLLYKDSRAIRAMLALGQPCLGAGSRHGGGNYLHVRSLFDGLRFCITAKGAYPQFQSLLRAGGLFYHRPIRKLVRTSARLCGSACRGCMHSGALHAGGG